MNLCAWNIDIHLKQKSLCTIYSGTPPYGHLGNTVISLLRPLSLASWQKWPYIYLERNPRKYCHLFIVAKFFWPIGDRINGFPPCLFFGFMLDWLLDRIELKVGFHNTQARNAWQTPKNVCVGVSQIWSYCHVSGSIPGGDWSSYCREGKVADHLHKSWKQVCLFVKNASFVLVSPICPQPSQMIKDVYDFLHSLLPVPPLPQTYGSGRQGFWKPDFNWPVWSFPFQQSQHGMCPSNPED